MAVCMRGLAIFALAMILLGLSNAHAEPEVKIATVGNVQLEYLDMGAGELNIVIESGVGAGLSYWRPLLPELAGLNQRVIIYSRAGNGKSSEGQDLSLKPSVVRLHALLNALNANKSLVLVGHSYGGLHVREYAHTYPEEVSSLVLLDPSHERFAKELVRLDRAWAERDAKKLNVMLSDSQEWASLQGVYQRGQISDMGAINSIPTVIVTSSQLGESDWWIGHSKQGKAIMRRLHGSLITENPNSIHIVSSRTGHNVPLDAIFLSIKAIKRGVELIDGL